jgi:hypothetical protein
MSKSVQIRGVTVKLKPKKLTKRLANLLKEYREDAEYLYWNNDQGTPQSAKACQDDFDKSERKLVDYLAKLQAKASK